MAQPITRRELDVIAQKLQALGKNVSQLKTLTEGIGTARDNEQLRKKVKTIREESSTTVKALSVEIKKKAGNASDQQYQNRLASQFQSILKEFQELSKLSVQKEREFFLKQSDPGAEKEMQSQSSGGGNMRAQKQESIDVHTMSTINVEYEIARTKNQEIRDIERDMNELASIYVDMGTLVDQQQDAINLIDTNVDESNQAVEKGVVELKQASKYQIAARKKMCYIIVVDLVITS
eukprot:TRINITY_DN2336_c0_g1_i1.p1 TRINITY_DN2336_c0_g1~~TRINITY_DN2336_c0_g1_i1.p1  ORF type:complete len:235 (-),score=31.57 TRINITY_DN2336_c0_g1_i1:122-826(-)